VGVRLAARKQRYVNLVLPEISRASFFAGLRTALACGTLLADELDASIRIISYGVPMRDSDVIWLKAIIRKEMGFTGDRIEMLSGWGMTDFQFSAEDIFVATYWTTAHALDVAARSNLIDPNRVFYLIQDYEANFYAGSTESAVAQSTYHAGFRPLVNSMPLQGFLQRREGIAIPDEFVFRPDLDLARLSETSALRHESGDVTVGFYGRPSKPRNSFALGVSSLRAADRELKQRGIAAKYVSMGEPHPPIRIGSDITMTSVGKLAWERYFTLLAQMDTLLSLQQSPHPSHPPLDAVASGGYAVTNDMDESRAGLSPRLFAVPNDPAALGSAIADAVQVGRLENSAGRFDEKFIEQLGRPLTDVIRRAGRAVA
jgi:hypothetical protein